MNTLIADAPKNQETRAMRLKASTRETHDRLDSQIMACEPFADRTRYARFLKVQYLFHREIDALYDAPVLQALLPGLAERRRRPLIVQDLIDLGQKAPALKVTPAFEPSDIDVPAALGWLYTAEGSNLGAAFLLKAAGELGLNAEFGARHLAGHPQGRGLHWRMFTAALDALDLSSQEEERMFAGARAAFTNVAAHVAAEFAGGPKHRENRSVRSGRWPI